MHTPSLSARIERYLKSNPGVWVCGGELQKLAMTVGFEPSNAARRLRELSAEGMLEVEYRKGINKVSVAWYRAPIMVPSQMTLA